jgi:hypothetical protein
MLIGDYVYIGDEDGDVTVLKHGKVKQQVAEMNMGSSVYSTPVAANGVLFIANRNQLWALSGPPGAPPAPARPKTVPAKPPAAKKK